jgi:hypothetical protein
MVNVATAEQKRESITGIAATRNIVLNAKDNFSCANVDGRPLVRNRRSFEMRMRLVTKVGIMNDDPGDPTWKWTKARGKIKDIIRGGEEFMLEYTENGEVKTELASDLQGCSVWVGDEQILIHN